MTILCTLFVHLKCLEHQSNIRCAIGTKSYELGKCTISPPPLLSMWLYREYTGGRPKPGDPPSANQTLSDLSTSPWAPQTLAPLLTGIYSTNQRSGWERRPFPSFSGSAPPFEGYRGRRGSRRGVNNV